MGEYRRSQQIIRMEAVSLLILFKTPPFIFPADRQTVFLNLTRCFLQFLQANAATAHPTMLQFFPN
jgi:hypothetical protein